MAHPIHQLLSRASRNGLMLLSPQETWSALDQPGLTYSVCSSLDAAGRYLDDRETELGVPEAWGPPSAAHYRRAAPVAAPAQQREGDITPPPAPSGVETRAREAGLFTLIPPHPRHWLIVDGSANYFSFASRPLAEIEAQVEQMIETRKAQEAYDRAEAAREASGQATSG